MTLLNRRIEVKKVGKEPSFYREYYKGIDNGRFYTKEDFRGVTTWCSTDRNYGEPDCPIKKDIEFVIIDKLKTKINKTRILRIPHGCAGRTEDYANGDNGTVVCGDCKILLKRCEAFLHDEKLYLCNDCANKEAETVNTTSPFYNTSMLKLTTEEKDELQNIIRFAIDGAYVNSYQETILERVFNKIENDESDTQAITWSVEDVQSIRPDLTAEQSIAVLKKVVDSHDATIGVNWDVLEENAEQLFPKPNICGNCSNFEHYENENDGYGGCDAKHGTMHQDNNATECQDYI